MQKVEFNYYVWKNHPERSRIQLITRNGSPVTDFTDFTGKIKDTHQMQGVCDRDILSWDLDGNYSRSGLESGLDLFMIIPTEREMFIPIFRVPDDVNGGKKLMTLGLTETKEQSDKVGEALAVNDWEFLGTYKLVKQ